jgi:hypothetical protein
MNDLAKKLRIKEGDVLVTVNAPSGFRQALGTLPTGVRIVRQAETYNQVHWFVLDKAQMEKELDDVLKLLTSNATIWVYYPKGSSKIQTDLTRDKGWDKLLDHEELQWISLIAFDATWSAFAFRLKGERDKKRRETPKDRPILEFIDAEKKIVRLPDDFAKQLKKEKLDTLFNALAFTYRKEYVEWIVSAKRPETRAARIAGSMDRLAKGSKNRKNP